MEEEKDKEVKQLVKRLARFLGLEAVEKRVLGFKRHIALRDQHWKNVVEIRGCLANCLSWKDALCKLLGAECFMIFTEPSGEDEVASEILQADNPFFGMSFEEASLRLDLLAPEKKEREESLRKKLA